MTTLKISLLSAFATLFLLIAVLASSGTASAHTTSCQPQLNPACGIHYPHHSPASHPIPPGHIAVYNETYIGGDNKNCRWMLVVGYHFIPGAHVTLYAYYKQDFSTQLQVSPYSFTADGVGDISGGITICGPGMGDQVIYTQVGNGESSQLVRQNHLVAYENTSSNGGSTGVYSNTYTV
jgi:hypothetical protein